MINLLNPSRLSRLLCMGAHCDDIEIGAGATILRLIESNPKIEIHWVVFGAADATRREEAKYAAKLIAPSAKVEMFDFRDAFMQHDPVRVKESFERIKKDFNPDLILTHHHDDRHQDHRLINELTWNTWRNHTIFEYEIFKYDGDLGRPNVFSAVSEEHTEKKISVILEAFKSQGQKQWFTPDVFRGLMRLRGVECNSPTKYAEAFHARKLCL